MNDRNLRSLLSVQKKKRTHERMADEIRVREWFCGTIRANVRAVPTVTMADALGYTQEAWEISARSLKQSWRQ